MLEWALYTLGGTRLAELRDHSAGRVRVELDGQRTAQVTIPITDQAAGMVAPLSTVLRAWWHKQPIFAGIVLLPRFDQVGRSVEIAAVDPSLRLKASYVNQRSDGALLAYQGNVDQSEIMWRLIDHARETAAERADGVPSIPIARGDTPATFARDRGYESGKNVWESVVELSQVQGGIDFELAPLPPGEVIHNTAALCELRTYARQGADKTATARFTAGFAWENATLTWEPSGDTVVNRSTWQGQSQEGQSPPAYTSNQVDSQRLYGIYSDYVGDPDVSTAVTLAEHAQGRVSAAAFPIDFFDLVPAVDGRGYAFNEAGTLELIPDQQFATAPAFGPGEQFDYWVGDTISVHARVPPGIDGEFHGRVTDAEISEVEATGDCVVSVTVGPSILAALAT